MADSEMKTGMIWVMNMKVMLMLLTWRKIKEQMPVTKILLMIKILVGVLAKAMKSIFSNKSYNPRSVEMNGC